VLYLSKCLPGFESHVHFEGMKMGEHRCGGSEMDTPRQFVSCAQPVCQRSWTDFKPV
jgi:hypothetical protein